MHILKSKTTSTILRLGMLFCLGVIVIGATTVGILQGTFSELDGATVVSARDGVLDLRGDTLQNGTVYLNGMWEYHPNVFEVGESFDGQMLERESQEWAQFPLDDIDQAIGSSTYQLLIRTDYATSGYAFYIEHYNEDFAIYVNGERVYPMAVSKKNALLASLSEYLFFVDSEVDAGDIEVIVSANSNNNQALLYRNSIVFGSIENVVDYVARVGRDNTFLIGMILIMVTVGLLFVLMRARFDMLSNITFFDTLLAMRIMLGYGLTTYFIHNLMPWLKMDRVDFVALQYVVFFLTGVFGCIMSQIIFDPKLKLPTWPIWLQIAICGVGSVFTALFFKYMPTVCIMILFCTLVLSFIIVTWHIYHMIKDKQTSRYNIFQIIKTYYIGCIMAIDIMFFRGTSYNALVYAYLVFFLAHLSARIIDNNASYKEVETLNRDLEKIIASRTSELTKTNKSLSELSVRDPLTQAYNRLYFEEAMEKVLADTSDSPAHLCMFDLDFFKSINDRFGHVAGDEQLKFVVVAVNSILQGMGNLSRIGGEEFAILFKGATKAEVVAIVEQIRRKLHEDAKSNEKRTTASFGVVECEKGKIAKDIMRAADKCLYAAKKLGRNCVVAE